MSEPYDDPRIPHDGAGEADEAKTQEAFDRAAPALDLELEEVRGGIERSVGALVVPFDVTPTAEVEIDTDSTEPLADDDGEIRRVLEAFETASPRELVETWRTHGTRPLLAVGANWIGAVDEEKLEAGLASEEFRRTLEEFPPHHPRRVTLSELRIVYLAGVKAVATYRVEEEYRNGQVFAGNAGAILMNDVREGWKLALFTKRTRFLDFLPVG